MDSAASVSWLTGTDPSGVTPSLQSRLCSGRITQPEPDLAPGQGDMHGLQRRVFYIFCAIEHPTLARICDLSFPVPPQGIRLPDLR
ncbi:hypothetical protein GCM10011504_56070 [Siccirubricoccus deserti]|uniref:hypothetical protein n=1 Tax=Siccirubricoccus deserti TaxID=2013562 RepID=UPI00164664BB|nr:hypothetical protein [Siccirubricoccus deserti]GGC71113.1 hypothetical protein GCM10011504_56070 [Siccirubricoccus deserti]